ncbi:putative pterin-4-alpha-carbinolamine dehydratase [Meiothermus luteus]|uniref:Putative pterin-4-alpha-carbinolamine dehydratase n=1 Tax=Meiothermus luteus TaxID=2026184 RepID=A0A399EF04_9DEIN|nr:4a-hydroxytetrahydrobiopterin dehydratase [Meiothermus luteus]RIH83197.1 putative pterin-4-alpha-carbinolamine dehydratase [Meiothermus luteus]
MRLELESLLALAEEGVLERGRQRFLQGAILEAARGRQRLQARVAGSSPFPYRVEIDLRKGSWRCTCPYQGPICKHVVAVALAALEAPEIFVRRRLGRASLVHLEPLLALSEGELMRFLWGLAEARPGLLYEFAHHWLERHRGEWGRGGGMADPLSETEIQQGLARLPGWAVVEGRLEKTFSFRSYPEGVAFAVRVALLAERSDHHPDSLEIMWRKVRVAYVTHSAGGITRLDLEAAAQVEALV